MTCEQIAQQILTGDFKISHIEQHIETAITGSENGYVTRTAADELVFIIIGTKPTKR